MRLLCLLSRPTPKGELEGLSCAVLLRFDAVVFLTSAALLRGGRAASLWGHSWAWAKLVSRQMAASENRKPTKLAAHLTCTLALGAPIFQLPAPNPLFAPHFLPFTRSSCLELVHFSPLFFAQLGVKSHTRAPPISPLGSSCLAARPAGSFLAPRDLLRWLLVELAHGALSGRRNYCSSHLSARAAPNWSWCLSVCVGGTSWGASSSPLVWPACVSSGCACVWRPAGAHIEMGATKLKGRSAQLGG